MKIELTEALWMDEREEISITRLAEVSGLSEADLRELMDCDALVPSPTHAPETTFTADCIVTARTAYRLRSQLDLDAHGLAVVLSLLDRVRNLESELRNLQAQLPGGLRR